MNWLLLKNSLLVSAQTTICAVLLGFFSAIWTACLERRSQIVVVALSIIALALPPFLVTNCWLHLLGNAGIWRKWLPFNIISFGGTTWILTLLTWPVAFFFTLGALRRIEKSYFEVEPMLGGLTMIRSLLLPLARNEIIHAAVITFVLALNNFAVPVILQTKVFPEEVWLSFTTNFDYLAALKLSWPLIVVPLLVLFMLRRQTVFWLWKSDGVSAKAFRRHLGEGWFGFGAVWSVLILIVSVALPVAQILLTRQTWADFVPAMAAGSAAIISTFVFAALAALVVVTVGVLTFKWPLRTATWLTFLVPGMLLGIALIWALNRRSFALIYPSIGIVIFALALRYLAPGWNAVSHALKRTDRNLNDAAEIEGANRWQLFRHVHLPQIAPQIGAAWYIVYVFCLWDVETLVFIIPPGVETVALRVFNLLHYGHNSQVNALCLSMLLLAILPLLAWYGFCFWTKRTSVKSVAAVMGLAVLVGAACSCSVSNDETAENRFPIESRLFSHVEIIGSRGTAPGQFNKPRSLALDRDDNLFVVDMTGRVQKFSSNGVYLLSWQMPQTDLGKAKGMSRDNDGHVVVVEPHYQRVNHFASDGTLFAQWGVKGTNRGELVLPRSVGVNSRGDIILSEYTTVDRVQVFSPYGNKWLFAFGKTGSGDGEFNRPEGVGIDAQDRIYVADSCNHRIQVFAPDGKFLRSYGKAGSGMGEVSYPYDVRIDAAGLQYVCEFGNSRIQIFDVNNQPMEILGKPGGAPGDFANPWSIALDSKGNLYVADSQNHRVQKFLRKVEHRTSNIARPRSKWSCVQSSMFDVRCLMFSFFLPSS